MPVVFHYIDSMNERRSLRIRLLLSIVPLIVNWLWTVVVFIIIIEIILIMTLFALNYADFV